MTAATANTALNETNNQVEEILKLNEKLAIQKLKSNWKLLVVVPKTFAQKGEITPLKFVEICKQNGLNCKAEDSKYEISFGYWEALEKVSSESD